MSEPLVTKGPPQTLTSPFGNRTWQSGWSPPPPQNLRIYIRGPVKSRKTTFLASIPRIAIFDFENKVRHCPLHGEGSCYLAVRDLKEFELEVAKLIAAKKAGTSTFDMIGIDSLDAWLEAVKVGMVPEIKGAGGDIPIFGDATDFGSSPKGSRGWSLVGRRIERHLSDIHSAGFGWVLMGHEKEVLVSKKKDGVFVDCLEVRPGVPNSILGPVARAAELLGTTNIRSFSSTKDVPVLDPRTNEPILKEGAPLLRKEVSYRTSSVLEFASKEGDKDTFGNNLALQGAIEIEWGQGWSRFVEEYNKVISKFKTPIQFSK